MRQLGQFPGGLILDGHKDISTNTPITTLPISPVLTLPLQQHIGQAAEPIVEVGQTVKKGQRIAKADGHVSVCLHAPSSGKVTAIASRPVPHPSGLSAPCIEIETDGKDEWTTLNPADNYQSCSEHEIRQKIRDAGIVGLGGAGFPSFIKLNPGIHHFVDTLILNGVECEPYISCDDMLMQERADAILDGLAIMQYALKAKQCLIAIEDNKPDAIAAMETALLRRQDCPNTQLITVPTRYPSGGEKQLIQVLTNKQVPQNGLPIDLGIVMHNVATAYAVGKAILYGEPLISRIVTLTGTAVGKPGNVEVPFGTPIQALLDYTDTQYTSGDSLVQGGPMMGYQLASADLPITKTANCILVGISEHETEQPAMPCIRCGDCATACPANLLPQQLFWHTKAKEIDKAQDYNLFDCIECGCCNYVCPSNIPLVQYFKFAKTEAMHQQQEQQKSDIARTRHDNRQARLEREKQEKALRQQQRKAALAASQAAKKAQQDPA